MLHEALVSLFHNEPALAPDLLESALGIPMPECSTVTLEDVTLGQVVPTQYRADAVIVLRRPRPVLAIVLEVQLRDDEDKWFTWPLYAATLRARLRCPVTVLVVTPRASVAAWASRTVECGAGFHFEPCVIGPGLVPLVCEVEEAVRRPELAVLSVLAHGHEPGAVTLAEAAFGAIVDLDEERAKLYYDLVLNALADEARAEFEKLMKTKYEYQSEFARRYVAQGREEGREEGLEAGMRQLVRRQLDRAGIELDAEASQRLDTASLAVLEEVADGIATGDRKAIAAAVARCLR